MNTMDWQSYQAIYVHIPFCRQKCLYCDFASYAGFSEAVMRAYTEALCHEIKIRAEEAAKTVSSATVYFGGGTPSVLPIDCLEQLVSTLKECGFWRQPAEASIEVNPGTADAEKLRRLRACGFDRISFGVQSLQDNELRTIGRIHSAQQALEAIDLARSAGFARISCDLIYALPGQTLASLQDTLQRLLATGIEHVSVYGLIVEEGTPLEQLVDSGGLVLPDEDMAADMYELVQRTLREQGFARYEISNYAKQGQLSRHNSVYWQYHPYLAFGAAACGFAVQEQDDQLPAQARAAYRRTASATVDEYIELATGLTQADWRQSALYSVEELTPAQQLEEFMFMGLRQCRGADLREARLRFGVDVWQYYHERLQPFLDRSMVRYDAQLQRLYLTEAGMELGNQVFEVFVGE